MPEGMAATARVLNEIARSLWMFGGDMVGLCVSAIAGEQWSKHDVRPGRERLIAMFPFSTRSRGSQRRVHFPCFGQ